MIQNSRSINYIQYLRALSVLLVFFYHLKLDFFKNGYLGVDIFFIISGYVIKHKPLKKIIGFSLKLLGMFPSSTREKLLF